MVILRFKFFSCELINNIHNKSGICNNLQSKLQMYPSTISNDVMCQSKINFGQNSQCVVLPSDISVFSVEKIKKEYFV